MNMSGTPSVMKLTMKMYKQVKYGVCIHAMITATKHVCRKDTS